ncbi:hypothetical protein IH601_04930 [Candidatus Bipolaricaulota bacterium]|nr:hypothetical protein [Candidatus Bipolaricaulota bacterium]TFH06528.1 MAG: hypothetical protein E4H08_10890 [Candidatus Atribacteria bacterium]
MTGGRSWIAAFPGNKPRFDSTLCVANPDVGVSEMSKAARSLFVFGVYLVVLGLFLLIVPNTLITQFGLPEPHDVWIQLLRMLLVLLAFCDIRLLSSLELLSDPRDGIHVRMVDCKINPRSHGPAT